MTDVPKQNGPEGSDQEKIVHVYDDIREADNALPRWWLWVLYGSIAFAGAYFVHFHVLHGGLSPGESYEQEMAAVRAEEAEKVKRRGALDDNALATLAKDPNTVKQGKEVFTSTCAPCHGPEGGGSIGPNLTDPYWIHGGAPTNVLKTVSDGAIAKGMPAWGAQLGTDRVTAVTAYVLSLKDTNVPGGKPPQGEREAM